MIKIINNQKRSILCEGRSNQMGFAFCKHINGDDYETVQPISPCKDYLNDVVYAEHTDKPISAYGLHCKGKQGLFNKQAYLVISICPFKYDHSYNTTTMLDDIARLDKYHKYLEEFINYFEEALGVDMESNTMITKVEDNLFLVELPTIWTESTYMISLYSLLLRVGQFYNNRDINPMEYLETFKDFQPDISLIKSALPKLKLILANGPLPQDFSELQGDSSTHNLGIVGIQLNYSKPNEVLNANS